MTSHSPCPLRAATGAWTPLPPPRGTRLARTIFLDGLRGALLVLGGLILVALTALLDYRTGPHLSFSVFYLIPVAACAWWGGLPHGILLALAGALAWHFIDLLENPLMPTTAAVWNGIVRFGTLALASSLVSRLHAGVRREQLLARTDPLTGAANGRTFYEMALRETERARRTQRPLTLAYLDLDNFKQLNDRLGHATGDEALRHVVQAIRHDLRDLDLLARLGGDEFALLLPETDGAGALALLSRVQGVLAQEMAPRDWQITLSIGAITFLQPPEDVDLMIQQVDLLMYGAKRKGKGRVEHAVMGAAAETWRGIERRATARVLCGRGARVRTEGLEPSEEYATVRDISIGGIALTLDRQFPEDTLLIVEPLLPGAPALLVRVVHVRPDKAGWTHGCQLSGRLGTEELRRWVGEHLEVHAVETPVS
jgi:diguanylate cyclase (GGDEF)-like protein